MKKTESQSTKPTVEEKKSRRELILGISNLVLTAIIGIGIAIYLHYRDEQAQKDLIALQAETQRQSSLAHIKITPTCLYYTSCAGSVLLTNTGPANAKNIKIVIVLGYVSEEWSPYIKDIKQFQIKTFPPSVDIVTSTRKVDTLYFPSELENNAYELTISNLPPQEEMRILLDRDQSIATQTYTINAPVTIYIQSTEPTAQLALDIPLRKYLEERYNIAGFSIATSCENCEGNIDEPTIVVSSLGSWGFHTTDFTSDNDGFNWSMNMNIDVEMPNEITYTPNNSPLYLRATFSNDANEFILQETSQK